MKYNFTFIEPVSRGELPLESSATITTRGIQAGKKLREVLNLDSFKYVKIGIDEKAKAVCLIPTTNKPGAFKAGGEFGGTNLAKRIVVFLGRKPFVQVEDGVVVLTAKKPEKPEDPPIYKEGEISEEPKRRGRPKREDAKVEPKEERKDACENCDYHKPIPGQAGRIKCEKLGQTKNVDDYCFHYEPELK